MCVSSTSFVEVIRRQHRTVRLPRTRTNTPSFEYQSLKVKSEPASESELQFSSTQLAAACEMLMDAAVCSTMDPGISGSSGFEVPKFWVIRFDVSYRFRCEFKSMSWLMFGCRVGCGNEMLSYKIFVHLFSLEILKCFVLWFMYICRFIMIIFFC